MGLQESGVSAGWPYSPSPRSVLRLYLPCAPKWVQQYKGIEPFVTMHVYKIINSWAG